MSDGFWAFLRREIGRTGVQTGEEDSTTRERLYKLALVFQWHWWHLHTDRWPLFCALVRAAREAGSTPAEDNAAAQESGEEGGGADPLEGGDGYERGSESGEAPAEGKHEAIQAADVVIKEDTRPRAQPSRRAQRLKRDLARALQGSASRPFSRTS